MRVLWTGVRGLVSLLLLFASVSFVTLLGVTSGSEPAYAQAPVIRTIKVEGNRRVEPETVRSYLQFAPGDRYNALKVNESIKSLFSTGLFTDVRIRVSGSTVVVKVVESPIIHQVAFEGNSEIEDKTLESETQLKPRAVYSRARVQADVQRIQTVYRQGGRYATRVEPKIIQKEQNRIDLVYEIDEGPKTTVRSINFVGNYSFSDSQLSEVITTTETGLMSFLRPTNIYDPDRLNLDRELLRQYYLKNGYADARVIAATADLDPNGQGFFITFTIEEGEQYKFGTIDVETSIAAIDPQQMAQKVTTKSGKIYDASKVDKSLELVTEAAASFGYAFARVRPRIDRDPVARIISLTYVIEEGPRVYIERIDIIGNTRTQDYVIRREFRLAEGDAFNRLLVNSARRRLTRLQFFKKVDVGTEPGSAPDRVIITVRVQEQPTGELSLGGGWSSNSGVIADITLSERNLLGKGQYVQLRFRGNLDDMNLKFSFTEPKFLGRNMSAGIDVFHIRADQSDSSSFSSKRTGGGLRFGVPLNDKWRTDFGYKISQEEIFDVQNDASPAIKGAQGEALVSAVHYTFTYDTRNHPKKPSRGVLFTFGQEFAGLGGDVNYLRTTADLRAYYPIYKKAVLAGRLNGGYIDGLNGDEVRILDLFFAGTETIRGFDTAGIGPRDLNTGDALGGKIFAASSLELRFPAPAIPERYGVSLATFIDAATLHEPGDLSGLSVSSLGDDSSIRASVGFGLIWESPLGPLRADFGFPLLSENYDDEKVFSFGAAARF